MLHNLIVCFCHDNFCIHAKVIWSSSDRFVEQEYDARSIHIPQDVYRKLSGELQGRSQAHRIEDFQWMLPCAT